MICMVRLVRNKVFCWSCVKFEVTVKRRRGGVFPAFDVLKPQWRYRSVQLTCRFRFNLDFFGSARQKFG